MAQVFRITGFPLKGFSGQALAVTPVSEGVGIPGDRALAFRFADSPPDSVDKRHFLQWANTPACARLRCHYEPSSDHLSIFDGDTLFAQGTGPGDAERISSAVSTWYRDTSGKARDLILCRARYPDVPDCDLSLLHMESLRDVEARLGQSLLPERLRMNVLVDGDEPPWIERSWVGGHFRLGSAVIEVMGMLPRCPAPDANPKTGVRDRRLVRDLLAHFGHTNLGILARVRVRGTIAVGDAITPLATTP